MNGAAMYVTNQNAECDEMVVKHSALVKRIAFHLMSRLPPSVQADDLIQAGMISPLVYVERLIQSRRKLMEKSA